MAGKEHEGVSQYANGGWAFKVAMAGVIVLIVAILLVALV